MLVYISKAGKSIEVNWDAMPEATQKHIIEYGLRQKLNDAGASATTKELGEKEAGLQAFAAAEVVVAALLEGKITVRSKGASVSFEDKTRLDIIAGLVKKQSLPEGTDIADLIESLGTTEEKLEAAIAKLVASKVAARDAAKRARDEAKSLTEGLDLSI